MVYVQFGEHCILAGEVSNPFGGRNNCYFYFFANYGTGSHCLCEEIKSDCKIFEFIRESRIGRQMILLTDSAFGILLLVKMGEAGFAVSIAAALFDLKFIDLFDMIMNRKRNTNK